jgi:hypothetical protein
MPKAFRTPSGFLGRAEETPEVAVEVKRFACVLFQSSLRAKNPRNGGAGNGAYSDVDQHVRADERQRRSTLGLGSERGCRRGSGPSTARGRYIERKTLKGNETPREVAIHIGCARGETGVLDEYRPAAKRALEGRAPNELKLIDDRKLEGKVRPTTRCRDEYLHRRRTDEASRSTISARTRCTNPRSVIVSGNRASSRAGGASEGDIDGSLATASFARISEGREVRA